MSSSRDDLLTEPRSLILVMNIIGKVGRGSFHYNRWEVAAHDFGKDLIVEPLPEDVGRFRTITSTCDDFIVAPDVLKGHIQSRGTLWSISDPARYPPPPFLLTDDTSYRLIKDCFVSLDLRDDMKVMIHILSRVNAKADIPVMTDSWFGMIRILDNDIDNARLIAFTNSHDDIYGIVKNIRCADLDYGEDFGSILVPER